MKAAALLLVLFAAASPEGHAQVRSVFDDSLFVRRAEAGLHLLYNMKFEEAGAVFTELGSRYPRHPAVPFFSGLNVWWMILTDLENESYDKRFARLMQDVIDRADRRLDRNEYDVDGLFFKGLAIGLRGRLRSNRGSWYGAARDAKASYKYVVRAAEIDPSNHDYYFGWGIYDYFVDAIPRDKWYLKGAKLFFPGGDRERGIAELERTFNRGRFLRAEAAYFLLQIFLGYESDYRKASFYAIWLNSRYPDNAWFHVLRGRVEARWGRWRDAESIMEEVIDRCDRALPGYGPGIAEQAHYYRGRARMLWGRYEEAKSDFHLVVFTTERLDDESVYGLLARLRLGMLHDAMGERTLAVSYYRQVLKMDDRAGAHEVAERYLETPYQGRAYYRSPSTDSSSG